MSLFSFDQSHDGGGKNDHRYASDVLSLAETTIKKGKIKMQLTKRILKESIKENKYHKKLSLKNWLITLICQKKGYSAKDQLQDITTHGLAGGCINELIYTSDCLIFYKEYEQNIWETVQDFMDNTGQTLGEFIDSFNTTIESSNTLKVSLCWFSIEQIAMQLLDSFEGS
jgi:hypothetical protein